jgi:hypothetical protein
MSLLMPALLGTQLNDSNKQHAGQQQIAFMQIDCEVMDTRLFYMNLNEIPIDYMKILNQDYIITEPTPTKAPATSSSPSPFN